MANEFTPKPSSIKPAVTGTIANADDYNKNIAGQSKDSILPIDEDGNFADGDLGDETIGSIGALISDLKLRNTAQITTYDASGVLDETISFSQATESVKGTAELATQAETDAGTDDLRIVTPLKLANTSVFSGLLKSIQTFTSSGTWTKPAGITAVLVKVQAGGGAGNDNISNGAGGGGAGGYSEEFITNPGSSETVTVGAGGSIGSNPANSGASSSFGSFLSATGGEGAPGSNDDGAGGNGGVGSGGDINITGSGGSIGAESRGGNGGSGMFSGGGAGSVGSSTANNGNNGGGGGGSDPSGTPGAGGSGLIVVYEYS